jgi:hypothetical protein
MTLAEAGEIFAHWEQNPPPHLMLQTIARMLGWTPPTATAAASLAAAPPPGLATGPIDMPAPLDLDAMRARNRARVDAITRRAPALSGD